MGILDDGKLNNNRFLFMSVGILRIGFSKITNMSQSAELETIMEGGYNDGPRFFTKPKSKVETLVLEHGIKNNFISNLTIDSLKVGTKVSMGIIMVMDGMIPLKTLYFEYGIITKLDYGELDAVNKTVLIRKLEISHTGLIEG